MAQQTRPAHNWPANLLTVGILALSMGSSATALSNSWTQNQTDNVSTTNENPGLVDTFPTNVKITSVTPGLYTTEDQPIYTFSGNHVAIAFAGIPETGSITYTAKGTIIP